MVRLCPNTNSLKAELEGKTLIGEYIGNAECMHIVKYDYNTIKFYAIVDNNSGYTCLPPVAAFGFFRKYNLETVSVRKLGCYDKISELYNSLKGVYKEISEQDLENGGEGSVLYFVENDFNGLEVEKLESVIFNKEDNEFDFDLLNHVSSMQRTLVLGKIKTLEYRIIRKIREKAKHITVNEENNIKLQNSFMSQFCDLTEGFVLPKPKDYYVNFYYEIKNRIINLIKSDKIEISSKKHAKIDFNKIIHNFKLDNIPDQKSKYYVPILIETAYSIKLNYSDIAAGLNYQESNQNKIDLLKPNKLYHDYFSFDPSKFSQNKYIYGFIGFAEDRLEEEISLSEFYDSECLSRKFNISMKKQMPKLPELIKKAFNEKRKLIQNIKLNQKAEVIEISPTTQENIIELLNKKITEIGQIEDFVEEEAKKTHKKRIFLILPLGIPGIGKTYLNQFFFNYSQKKGIGFQRIKSDEIRKKCMDAYLKQNSSLTYAEVFKNSAEEANKRFKDELLRKISTAKSFSLIYCDKNFPPKALDSTLYILKHELDSSIEIISIGLFPDSADYVLPNKKFEISYGLLLSCIVRVLKRKNHPTLNGSESNKVGVVLSMFNAYKNFSVKNEKRLSKILKIKFSAEVEDDEFWIKKRIDTILIDLEDHYHYNNEDFSDIAAYAKDLNITETDFTLELEERLDKAINEYQ